MEIKEFKYFLKDGNYLLLKQRYVVYVDEINLKTLPLFLIKFIKHKFMAPISFVKIRNNKNVLGLKGNRILYRYLDRQLLVFDDQGKWVYRKIADDRQFALLKKGYKTLEKLYQINKLEFLDSNFTKEKLINGRILFKENKTEQTVVFESILKRYIAALSGSEFTELEPRIDIDTFIRKVYKTNYPKEMINYIITEKERVSLFLQNCIWTWNHSDLTPDNVLFNEEKYYIIDLERCEVMPVFYDILIFMVILVLLSDNSIPLNNYFNGKYDTIVKRLMGKSEIDSIDRKVILVTALMLKAIVAWDANRKHHEVQLMQNRWDAIKKQVLK